jgi:predicted 3-demethylubiquinone-9 3-methyltransferase (glyoxalase superfamily)
MQKVTPFLWFDTQAEEAANYYVGIFKNSRIVSIQRSGDNGPVSGVTFELDGETLMGFNGGPQFKFTEAISLFVNCTDQAEVDYFWEKLTAGGGTPSRCGWLKDKYGVSWQIIPESLSMLLGDPDPAIASRVLQAMLEMSKIDVAGLEAARDNNETLQQ